MPNNLSAVFDDEELVPFYIISSMVLPTIYFFKAHKGECKFAKAP